MPKKSARKRKARTPPKAATASSSSGIRITAARKELIAKLADQLAEIAPATSRGSSSFCVKNIAAQKGHKKLWKELSNKRKSIAAYLACLFRKYPRTPKRVVLEIVQGGVQWSANRGKAVLQSQIDAIADVLEELGVDARRELKRITLPDPSKVAPPTLDLQATVDRLELHAALRDDCVRMFKAGHLNEAVRKALERFEKKIQDAICDHSTIGKSLMAKAFKKDSPEIPINELKTSNDESEQEGFMLLTMGAMAGMRNLYSHGDVDTIPAMDAFERLAFVSFLFKRVDQALADAAARAAENGAA